MDVYGQSKLPAGEKRRAKTKRRRYLKWVVAVALIIPLAWFSLQVFEILMPGMKTAIVTQGQMDDYVSARGIVAMDSVPVVSNNFSGALHYTQRSGKRVSKDVPVIEIFESKEALQACLGLVAVQDEINQLVAAEKIYYEGGDVDVFLKQRQEALINWVAAAEAGDYSNIAAYQNSIALAANKIQIVTEAETDFAQRLAYLYAQQAAMQALAVPQGYITAPENGYFVPAQQFNKIIHSVASLKSLQAAEIKALINSENYYENNVVGHIITSYKWHFVTVLPAQQAMRMFTGQSVRLNFEDYNFDDVPVLVESIAYDEAKQNATVEFKCENINADILKLRIENTKIVFKTEDGIKVDKKALHIVDGQNGVYVRFGNMLYFKKIDILLEDELQYLVKNHHDETGQWIQLYDEVIIDAGGRPLSDKQII